MAEKFRESKTVSRIRQKNLHRKTRGRPIVDIRFEPTSESQILSEETLLEEIQKLGKSGTRQRRKRKS